MLEHLLIYDDSAPPDVPDRYGNKPMPIEEDGPVESVLDASAELDELTGIALSKLREILSEPTDFDSIRMVNAQLTAVGQILTTQTKVDEGRLRRRKLDTLPKLLEIIAAQETKLAPKMLEMVLQDLFRPRGLWR